MAVDMAFSGAPAMHTGTINIGGLRLPSVYGFRAPVCGGKIIQWTVFEPA